MIPEPSDGSSTANDCEEINYARKSIKDESASVDTSSPKQTPGFANAKREEPMYEF
jgi:hypothetical protein